MFTCRAPGVTESLLGLGCPGCQYTVIGRDAFRISYCYLGVAEGKAA